MRKLERQIKFNDAKMKLAMRHYLEEYKELVIDLIIKDNLQLIPTVNGFIRNKLNNYPFTYEKVKEFSYRLRKQLIEDNWIVNENFHKDIFCPCDITNKFKIAIYKASLKNL